MLRVYFLHTAVSMNTLPHKCVILDEEQESGSCHHENLLRLYLRACLKIQPFPLLRGF